jgi:hypothetical protein
MVGWWPGDAGATDIVGGHNGTLSGATLAAGKVGEAFELNGQGSQVTIPDGPEWTLGSEPFTIELWALFHSVPDRAPLVDHNEGPTTRNKWVLWYDAWGHREPRGPALRFHVNGPGLPIIDAVVWPWVPETGRWYHLAITREGASYSLHADGERKITETDDHAVPDAQIPLSFGQSEQQYFFDGLIDEVAIFNRALSDAEIAALYAAGSGGKCR